MICGPRKLVKKAVFISQLLEIDEFELEIKFTKKPKRYYGQVEQLDDRSFLIKLSKDVPKDLVLETLAHEMVHVKQYLKGELVDVGPIEIDDTLAYVSKWKGETHINGKSMDDYYLSPWEMEARALQEWIVFRWDHRRELHG